MQYVLGESTSTSLSADRANSCTVPELLQKLQTRETELDLCLLLLN